MRDWTLSARMMLTLWVRLPGTRWAIADNRQEKVQSSEKCSLRRYCTTWVNRLMFQLEQCTQLLFCSVAATDSRINLEKVMMELKYVWIYWDNVFFSRMLTTSGRLWPGSRENTRKLTHLESLGIRLSTIFSIFSTLPVQWISEVRGNLWLLHQRGQSRSCHQFHLRQTS